MNDVDLIRALAALIFFLIILSVPAIAGFFIAKDANARGMNGVGWGIGVFMVLIVFLPLYFIIRTPIITQVPQVAASALRCATCGKYFAPGSRFCPTCGQAANAPGTYVANQS